MHSYMSISIKEIKIEDDLVTPMDNSRISSSEIKKIKEDAKGVKESLKSQPKVYAFIPLAKGETEGAVQPFNIGKYRFTVLKGKKVKVPKQVGELISKRFGN